MQLNIKTIPVLRLPDKFGAGYFNAPRGARTHNGIDLAVYVGSKVLAPITGKVTKVGYPYGDDLSYRYVEITDSVSRKWRFFYVEPAVKVDDIIEVGNIIGTVQDLDKRYPGITPHIHLEIKSASGNFINPMELVSV